MCHSLPCQVQNEHSRSSIYHDIISQYYITLFFIPCQITHAYVHRKIHSPSVLDAHLSCFTVIDTHSYHSHAILILILVGSYRAVHSKTYASIYVLLSFVKYRSYKFSFSVHSYLNLARAFPLSQSADRR